MFVHIDWEFPDQFRKITPDLKDLLNWLDSIVHDWYILGKKLGVKTSKLKAWRMNNRSENEKLSDVLDSWYQSMCSAYTYGNLWNVLVEMEDTFEARTKIFNGLQSKCDENL